MQNDLIEIILGISALLATTYIGLAVYIKNPKSWTNRFFALLALVINNYIISNYLSLHPPEGTIENQLFWIRVVMSNGSFIGPLVFLLVHTFPKEKIQLAPKYLVALGILAITSAIVSMLSLVFKSLYYINGQPLPEPGLGMPIFFIDFIGLFFASFVVIIYKYIHTAGQEKIKLLYLLLGILASFSMMGLFTTIFVVTFQTSAFVFLGPIFPVILMSSIAYAIVKHHFLDIQPIIARAVSYILLIVVVAVIYSTFLFLIVTITLKKPFDVEIIVISIALAAIIALTFQSLDKKIRKLTDKIFFKGLYNSDELLSSLTNVMIGNIELDRLTKDILEKMIKELRATKAAFLLIENHKIIGVKGIGYNPDNFDGGSLESLAHEGPDDQRKHFLLGNLTDEKMKNVFSELDIELAIPIKAKDKEVAILILGPKSSGDLYSEKDLLLLEIFASESGIAIQNSKLYDDLKTALEAKSQFISVVSHQMRTPLSAIRWSLELLKQKGVAPAKRKEFLNNAYSNSIFLVEQLDDVLTVLSIQKKEISLSREMCDLGSIVNELLAIFHNQISSKKLNVTFDILNTDLHTFCDMQKMKKVLSILLKNAVTYTPEGGQVHVKSEEKEKNGKNCLVISIHDTGIGLTDEERKSLFEKFWRGSQARLILPDGMGLGMFIAKVFIEAHNGWFWAESGGRDKGSTF